MKRILPALLIPTFAMLLFGCEYTAPLVEEDTIPVDQAIIGLWEIVPDSEDEEPDARMMVLKYSDTEYLVHYPIGEDDIYFRAYPIKVGQINCVQLKVIGTEEGPLEEDEKELFQVASYALSNSVLEVRILNTDLVDPDLKTPEALRKAFLEHMDDKELFMEPEAFRRVD